MVNKKENKELAKAKRMLNWYNMVPNVIWSALNLAPIAIFCYTLLDRRFLYAFITVSIIPIFFPNSFFNKLQLGKTIRVYKKLGVGFVNRVTQNGAAINNLMRRKFPGYKTVIYQRSSINKLLQQTYMFEKFHFCMFLFFTLTMVYALIKYHFLWGLIIAITNVLYNIYPNLLQQYIRLKLILHSKRIKTN
jgi:hypothetical protein